MRIDEVGHTDVSAHTVRFLLTFFLLAIAAVPSYEMVKGRVAARSGGAAPWEHLTRLPEEIRAGVMSVPGDAEGVAQISSSAIVCSCKRS